MKCKLDENLGAATHRRLADAGHDVSTVVLQRMAGAPDSAVFERCATEGRVLVTCDLDFANPFVFDPRPTAGVVVLRLPKAHGPTDVLDAVDRLIAALQEHTVQGTLWIVSATSTRRFVPPSQ